MKYERNAGQTNQAANHVVTNSHGSSGLSRSAVVPIQKVSLDGLTEHEAPKELSGEHLPRSGSFIDPYVNRNAIPASPDVKPYQLKPNNTGLPDNLKSGVESLSGFSMHDVKVHYNSSKPAQLNALAYAQGTDIHIAPGQEQHLPHEAWHVAQQKQGRVKPTMQMQLTDDIPVQRKVQSVQVKWDVTHIVREVGGSLFGGDDFTENETQELTAGTKLLIDDESTFISRRGSNQENREKRAAEKLVRPSILWYQVMQLPNGLDASGMNLYIRGGTFMADNTKVPGELSKEDKYWLEKFAGEARAEGEMESDNWRDRTAICNSKLDDIHATIRHMYSLKSLGIKIVQNASIFRVFSDKSIDSAAAADLIAKYVAVLSINPRYIGIIVNGLDAICPSLLHLANYLSGPYDTLVSTYGQLDSVVKKKEMFGSLAQPEQNIEKYTTLITSRLMHDMLRDGGIVEELKSMLTGHPTASRSAELLIRGIAGDFFREYVKSVNGDDELIKRDLFNKWLTRKGFTFDALVTALGSQPMIGRVDLSVVESIWTDYFKNVYDVYE